LVALQMATVTTCRKQLQISRLWLWDQSTFVGSEPTQLVLVELESVPFDHLGKVSLSRKRAGQVIHMRHAIMPMLPLHFERKLPRRGR
jgi:hypothetical protein